MKSIELFEDSISLWTRQSWCYTYVSNVEGLGDFTDTVPFLAEIFMLLEINFAFKSVKTTPR